MPPKSKPINAEQQYLSPRQTARLLGVSEFLIYREVSSGTIPHRKLGQRILIPVAWARGNPEA